jgi:hypothetical protein
VSKGSKFRHSDASNEGRSHNGGNKTAFGGIDEIITQDWYCWLLPNFFVEVKLTDGIGLIGISRIEFIPVKLVDLACSRYLSGGIV